LFGYSRHIRQTQVVRLHHDRDDGYGHTQPDTTFCLLLDQLPVAVSALCILFSLRRVIERKLDVMEGAQVMVFQNGNTVTVGSDGELHRSSSQVNQYSLVVRMHSVLAGAEIHGANRKAFDHRLDLF
jgi:hypothetical protein